MVIGLEGEAVPELATNKERLRMLVIAWNKEDPGEVASARKTFTEHTRKGWLAFAMTPNNKKNQVFTFNPEFGKVLLVPIVEGG